MTAQAQTMPGSTPIPVTLPLSPEHQADPGAGRLNVANTGTDAIFYRNENDPELNGKTLQLMTWDEGDRVYLSWDFFENAQLPTGANNTVTSPPDAKGSTSFLTRPNPRAPLQRADPDVVLAYAPGPDQATRELYANVAYITNGQTNYSVYHWDIPSHRFVLVGVPIPLGDNRFDHSYPNIDANRNGLVAVTWQQTVTSSVTISVTSPSVLFPSFTIPQVVTFGRTVLAAGDIEGHFKPCYLDAISNNYGVYVLNPPTGFFEQSLRPDVAISEGDEDNAIVSSVFVRHFVDGHDLFSIENKVMVIQTHYNRCINGDEQNPQLAQLVQFKQREWDYSANSVIGTPRIAASSFARDSVQGTDVEVAIDRTETDCENTHYAIWNFGKSNGQFRATYTLVSPANHLIPAVLPAISCSELTSERVPNGPFNGYTIAWTGGPGDDPNNKEEDILAVGLSNGRFRNGTGGPTAQPDVYSRVNLGGNEVGQTTVSIAGRHSTTAYEAGVQGKLDPDRDYKETEYHVYLYLEKGASQLDYRRSSTRPGLSTGLQRGLGNSSPSPTLLQAYPNPSEGAVKIGVQLHPGEQVRRLTVLDAVGRAVAELPLPSGSVAEWLPAAGQPAGRYTVRAETSERTATVAVLRK
jgi:hypothetical protein